MKGVTIQLSRRQFADAIKVAARAAGTASTLPILAGVRLTAQDGQLALTATDLESAVRVRIPEEGGKATHDFVLNSETLAQIATRLPSEDVVLEPDGKRWVVRSGGAEWTLPEMAKEDFPQVAFPEPGEITLDKDDLLAAIQHTALAALSSKETSRLSLTGVHWAFRGAGGLCLTGTNGYRLHTHTIPDVTVEHRPLLLGADHLRALAATLRGAGGSEVSLGVGDGQVCFRCGSITASVRSMEEEYPDAQRVIPKGNPIGLNLDREGLMAALQRAEITTAAESGAVVLEVKDGELTPQLRITSSSSEKGETEETLPLARPVDAVRVSFRASYLIDALKCVGDERVKLWLADSETAGLIEGDDGRFLAVVMPIRLDL